MIRTPAAALIFASILISGCGKSASVATEKKPVRHVRITQFYAAGTTIPRGLTGKLCYGVENAAKLEMNPPSQDVWPSMSRCFEISPKRKTTYTLTAFGEDGSKDQKSLEVKVAGEPPRIYDLAVSAPEVHRGQLVRVCFKVENATKIKAGPGKFAKGINCLNDNPKKTTTYRITAYGEDRQVDTGTVTVKVR
jgi:hypothetical protein